MQTTRVIRRVLAIAGTLVLTTVFLPRAHAELWPVRPTSEAQCMEAAEREWDVCRTMHTKAERRRCFNGVNMELAECKKRVPKKCPE